MPATELGDRQEDGVGAQRVVLVVVRFAVPGVQVGRDWHAVVEVGEHGAGDVRDRDVDVGRLGQVRPVEIRWQAQVRGVPEVVEGEAPALVVDQVHRPGGASLGDQVAEVQAFLLVAAQDHLALGVLADVVDEAGRQPQVQAAEGHPVAGVGDEVPDRFDPQVVALEDLDLGDADDRVDADAAGHEDVEHVVASSVCALWASGSPCEE
ncbi:hypothetical protein L0U85_09850 [Glycomyces sp. L485]|uniref:hypothetical protein n=1 Tax=Glycomyces sp. L485 TaxID=2909235 RepID=UPI001F4B2F43|nr:hypothetical protein [Glycomyces sp. L485]MCH7231154.1 hypothetical protein [Glycomyces sp. L485]